MIPSSAPPLPEPARELAAEAARRRIAARLFGEAYEPVKLGRFRLLEVIGAGGMGVVHAAEDDRLKRIVALKVIREDRLREHAEERSRLLREARALARLSHPNVVQIHEVVESEDGIFIVMEYVPGDTLQHWLRGATRNLAEILRTFAAAGRGLIAAHRVGIVHRDFKPSNVMVGDDRVCILDFGLARGIPGSTEPTTTDPGRRLAVSIPTGDTSQTGQLAGTPGYMSPEHILGQHVDARSDQFSFCITLHEAVYGQRPFTPEQLLTYMRSGTPLRPASAGLRFRVPKWLRRLLARGLSVRPEDRYPSMAALLAALEHGVTAPRRRLQLAAATLLSGVAIAAVASRSPAPPDPCPDPSAQLAGVWDADIRASIRDAFMASEQAFIVASHADIDRSLDSYASGWLTARHDTCAATRIRGEQSDEGMDRRMRCLDERRGELAAVIEVLRRPDPALLGAADEFVHSLPDLSLCLDPGPRDEGPVEPSPEIVLARGKLERARLLQLASQVQEAVAVATEVVDAVADPGTQAEALLLLGRLHGRNLRRSATAIAYLDDAYNRATRAGRNDLVAGIWIELAFVHAHGLQQASEARRLLGRADSAMQAIAPDSLMTADRLDAEGHVLRVEGDLKKARERHRDALALRQEHLSAGHPSISAAQLRLASAAADDGDFAVALSLYRTLLAEQSERLGDDHPRTANAAFHTALTYIELGQHTTAGELLQRARPPMLAAYGADSPQVASVDLAQGQVDHAAGRIAAAIAHLTAALAIFEANFPPGHSERVLALYELVECYRLANDGAAAVATNVALLELHERHGVDLDVLTLLVNVGEYLCTLDRCREGYHYMRRLEEEIERNPPEDPGLHGLAPYGLGVVALLSDEPARALPLLEQALAIFEAHPTSAPYYHGSAARYLATALQRLHRSPARVRRLQVRAAEIDRANGLSP